MWNPFKRNSKEEGAGPQAKASPKSKAVKVVADLDRLNEDRLRKELDDWTYARDVRLDVHRPQTYLLQELYNDALVDSHLMSAIQSRILRIVNKKFVILNDKEVNEDKTKFIEAPWFRDMLRHWMWSIFRGYNLIYVKESTPGRIISVDVVPNSHIIPERRVIIKNVTDTDGGLPFDKLDGQMLYAQAYDAIGLLNTAAPYTILKRHSWASWDNFEQLFGVPIRVGKVINSFDGKRMREMHSDLENMGQSPVVTMQQGEEIEIIHSNQTDAFKVFQEKIKLVNEEVSKLINGQTMTADNGSSKSQAEVHQMTQDEITRADEKEILDWLNEQLKPLMVKYGYSLTDADVFGIHTSEDPKESIDIDFKLSQAGYNLSPEYIEKKYGVELDKDQPTKTPDNEPSNLKALFDFFD
jgi:phage gp29-like protein